MSVSVLESSSGAEVADLDRRVLGAGTTLRFALFVVLVTVSAVGLIWVGAPRPVRSGVRDPATACAFAVGIEPGDFGLATSLSLARSGTGQAYQDCMRPYFYVPWPWVVGGTALMFALALLGYWLLPRWKLRGGRLVPIRDPGLTAELAGFVRESGLRAAPHFVIDPVAATPSAVVFGHWRSRTVSLHAGLVASRRSDPDGFRTVVLHELAHIRNGDVGIAYAAEALWRASILVVLLPYAVLSVYRWAGVSEPGAVVDLWQTDWQLGLRGVLHPVALAGLVLLARADVLRTRELYADLDASHWSGARLLPRAARAVTADNRRAHAVLSRLVAPWRTHPVWPDRAESLLDPAILFGVRPTSMFLTGAAAIVVTEAVAVISGDLLFSGRWVGRVTAWAIAALVTGIVGVALWRSVTHAVLTGRRIPSGLGAGAWLGLGLAVGELGTFGEAGVRWLPPAPHVLLLLIAGSAALTWWAAQCAEVWIRTCRGQSLRGVHVLGLTAMLVVFGAWFEWWYTGGHLYLAGHPLIEHLARSGSAMLTGGSVVQRETLQTYWPALSIVVQMMTAPMLSVGGLLLWLFPLAAWARRRADYVPPWIRRALPRGGLPASAWSGLPPLRQALVPGAAGGALAVCATVAVRLWLHAHQDTAARYTQLSVITTALWLVLALSAAAGLTAVLTYWRTPRHPLPVALIAAVTAMLVGLIGTFALAATDGCVPPVAVLGTTCGWKTEGGWQLLRIVVGPYALGMGFYAVVVVLPFGLSLRAATARCAERRRSAARESAPVAAGYKRVGQRAWLTVTGMGAALGAVAVAVAQLWLHAVRPVPPTTLWLQRSYEWTAFALATSLIAAALLALRAARRCRSRQRAAMALAATGAAASAGFGTTFLLAASDGCVPYSDVIATTCAWRPRPAWLIIWLVVLPTWLATALCVAAGVIVMAVAWRAVRRRGRPAATAGEQRAQPWRARAYLALACVMVLALVPGWWLHLARFDTSPTANVLPASSSASPATADSRRQRITGWLATGGTITIQNLYAQTTTFGAALNDAAHNGGNIDPKIFGPLCENWIAQGRKALAGLPVPDAQLQALWHEAAQQAIRGGTQCVDGLRNSDKAQFTQGVRQLTAFNATFTRFMTQLQQLAENR